jgi:hypothetical protein
MGANKMGKHNYPEHRKNRDVSYSKSYKLLQLVGEERLKQLFGKDGMYTVSKILTQEYKEYISQYVVKHCRSRYSLGGVDEENI